MIQLPEIDTDDEDFLEFALLITFLRKKRTFQDCANHFKMCDDGEILIILFSLIQDQAHYIQDIIQGKISLATTKYIT